MPPAILPNLAYLRASHSEKGILEKALGQRKKGPSSADDPVIYDPLLRVPGMSYKGLSLFIKPPSSIHGHPTDSFQER